MANSWISNHLPWIVSIAVAAGSCLVMIQVAQARIDKIETEYAKHVEQQKALEQLPLRIEYISQQLQEIKQDLKEIKQKIQ